MRLTQFDQTRRYGVEIEAFGVDPEIVARALRNEGIPCEVQAYNHRTQGVWKIVSDASIQGPHPFELVSPPLRGHEGLETLRKVAKILQRLGVRVNRTCGFHVHHEAIDFEAKHLRNLIRLYARMEPTIDEAMPPSRRANRNRYCQSVRDYLTWRDNDRLLEGCQATDTVVYWLRARYYKLNLYSWLRYGTVEFRHHGGTTNPDKMVAWVVFTQMLVTKARTSSRITYRERRAGYCRQNPRDLLAVDLGIHAYWRQVDSLLQWAIHYLAARIRQHRLAARTGVAIEEAA